MGCYYPSLRADDFDSAINTLNNHDDVIFAPAEDGGYVMVGMTQETRIPYQHSTSRTVQSESV